MSKKRIRAEKIYEAIVAHKVTILTRSAKGHFEPRLPKWLLPATAEAYERMVEQMAKALNDYPVLGLKLRWQDLEPGRRDDYRKDATRSLCAIGITPPKKGRP